MGHDWFRADRKLVDVVNLEKKFFFLIVMDNFNSNLWVQPIKIDFSNMGDSRIQSELKFRLRRFIQFSVSNH